MNRQNILKFKTLGGTVLLGENLSLTVKSRIFRHITSVVEIIGSSDKTLYDIYTEILPFFNL